MEEPDVRSDRKRIVYLGYTVASIITVAVAWLVLPVAIGHDRSLFQRGFAVVTIVFFAYLSFRSTIYWQDVFATMTGRDKR